MLAELELGASRSSPCLSPSSTTSAITTASSTAGVEFGRDSVGGGRNGVGSDFPDVHAYPLHQSALQHSPPSNAPAKMPICSIREAVAPQVTLTYRELYVLPFQCYENLRKVRSLHNHIRHGYALNKWVIVILYCRLPFMCLSLGV